MVVVGKGAAVVSSTTVTSTPLLAGLVDDAGLFPPTALDMPDAVARHRADQRAGEHMLSHRFLCPAGRLEELRAELVESDRVRLGLIADQGGDGLDEVLAVIDRDSRLELALLEVPLARFLSESDPVGVAAAARAVPPVSGNVAAYFEPASVDGIEEVVSELSEVAGHRPVGAKLRCGGVRAELFPSPEQVAHVIAVCTQAGVPFKATAGLHQAVRHRDPETGFTHHGYLNLLLAAATAAAGAGEGELVRVVEIEQRDELARRIRALDAKDAARARDLLVSYGSCSTSTPVRQAREIVDSQEGDSQ